MDYREYLNKLVKEAEAITRTVTEQAKEAAGKAKDMLEIKKAEIERDKAFTSLGRIMYQIEKGTLKREDSIIAAAVKRIEDQETLIETLKAANKEAAKEAEDEAAKEAAQEEAAEVKTDEIIEAVAREAAETAVEPEEEKAE